MSFLMTYVPLTTTTVILALLLSSPATAQNEAEGALRKLAQATVTAELVQCVCFLKTREERIDELTAKANVTKEDMEPDGRYGAIVAAAREQVHTRLARTFKRMGRKDFCEYAWHAYGAASDLFAAHVDWLGRAHFKDALGACGFSAHLLPMCFPIAISGKQHPRRSVVSV